MAEKVIREQRYYVSSIAAQTQLAKAEEIFKTCSLDSQATKENMIEHLNSAYHSLQSMRKLHEDLPEGYENVASRIFYLYGKCLYGENMHTSRCMFELALTTQLVHLKVLDSSVLPKLSHNLQNTPVDADTKGFEPLQEYLEKTSQEEIVDYAQKLGQYNAFNFAASLRWMGATYQSNSRCNTPIYKPLYEKAYGSASKIWDAIAPLGDLQWKIDCHWEIAQMIYHTAPFRHYLQNPYDDKGALETLKSVEPYLAAEGNTSRVQELRTQIVAQTQKYD